MEVVWYYENTSILTSIFTFYNQNCAWWWCSSYAANSTRNCYISVQLQINPGKTNISSVVTNVDLERKCNRTQYHMGGLTSNSISHITSPLRIISPSFLYLFSTFPSDSKSGMTVSILWVNVEISTPASSAVSDFATTSSSSSSSSSSLAGRCSKVTSFPSCGDGLSVLKKRWWLLSELIHKLLLLCWFITL